MMTLDKDRVIAGEHIKGFDFTRFESMGVTPYYYDGKDVCLLVEVTRKNLSNVGFKRVFLLTPEECVKIGEFIGNINHLIILGQKKIETLKEMVVPILVEKIMV